MKCTENSITVTDIRPGQLYGLLRLLWDTNLVTTHMANEGEITWPWCCRDVSMPVWTQAFAWSAPYAWSASGRLPGLWTGIDLIDLSFCRPLRTSHESPQ